MSANQNELVSWRRNFTRRQVTGFVFATAVALSACTAEQAYNGMVEGQRTQCLKLPPPQQAECLAEDSMGYEEYQRLRNEAIAPTLSTP